MPRMLGLRRSVTTKETWYYLILYDIDSKDKLDIMDLEHIDSAMKLSEVSYILYRTKRGFHIVGLTPLNILQHALVFTKLKARFNSYYSGDAIRLSRKEDEIQELVKIETNYGEVIPNLYNLYAKRFNYQKMPFILEFRKYSLGFEKYRTLNE